MEGLFTGEIRLWPGALIPKGWHLCDGTELSVPQYQELFKTIGTTYGGTGKTHFALPDLRGRVPLGARHQLEGRGSEPSSSYVTGASGGAEKRTTTIPLVRHSHAATFLPGDPVPHTPAKVAVSSADATTISPKGNILAKAKRGSTPVNAYASVASTGAHLGGVSGGGGGGISGGTVTIKEAGTEKDPQKLEWDLRKPYLGLNYIICLDKTLTQGR